MDLMTRDPQLHRPEPPRRSWAPPGVMMALLVAVAVVVVTLLVRGSSSPSPATQDTARPVVTAPVAGPVAPAAPDFPAVVANIVTTANDLRIHPEPAQLLTYMEPTNPDYADALAAQTKLAAGAIRYDPAPTAPVLGSVQVVSLNGDSATLDVTFTSTPRYRVVNRLGVVVSDTAAGPASARWTLHRSDGTWRIASAVGQ